jgi:hypothetical protein
MEELSKMKGNWEKQQKNNQSLDIQVDRNKATIHINQYMPSLQKSPSEKWKVKLLAYKSNPANWTH